MRSNRVNKTLYSIPVPYCLPRALLACANVSMSSVHLHINSNSMCGSPHTDAASCAIVKFLEIESTEESSNGWMLLSSLNLLSSGAGSLIDCMTAASLPSTLVKCLYLFFDLPDVENPDILEAGCEFTAMERRVLLQKVFVQVSGWLLLS